MDSHGSVDETIRAAKKEFKAGNYRGALALLLPLLRAKEKLPPQQELNVVKSLLPLLVRREGRVAARRARGRVDKTARSKEHSRALKGLCMVHSGLKAFPEARKAIRGALTIMEALGLQQDEDYGSMLLSGCFGP
jgi:hypothetical protein